MGMPLFLGIHESRRPKSSHGHGRPTHCYLCRGSMVKLSMHVHHRLTIVEN